MGLNGLALDSDAALAIATLAQSNGDGVNAIVPDAASIIGSLTTGVTAELRTAGGSLVTSTTVDMPPPYTQEHLAVTYYLSDVTLEPSPAVTYTAAS